MNTKALIAEFVGTFTLIFVGVSAIAVNQMAGGISGLVGIALAHGLAIAVMISATAAISGGHLNPAVTIAAMVTKKIDNKNGLGYIIAQLLGAVVATVFVKMSIPEGTLTAVGMGTPSVGVGVTPGNAFIMEVVLTFFLVFVVFGTAIDKRAPKYVGGLMIGLTVTLDILAGGPISGGCMNPARFTGPALLGGSMENMWLYWVGPVVGGVLAGLVYHHTLEEK